MSTFGVDLDAAGSDVERALLSYLYWNKLIEALAIDLTVRVEDAESSTLQFLKNRQLISVDCKLVAPPPKDVNADKLYRGTLPERPTLTNADWADVPDDLKSDINDSCARYGYELLYR